MLSISTSPPETIFAGNPVQFKINTNNHNASNGLICQFTLVVSAADTTAGHTISFAFPDKTIVFTNVTTPDDSGLQIQKAAAPTEFSIWAQRFYDCLMSNFDFCSRLKVTLGEPMTTNRALYFVAHYRSTHCSPYITTNLVTVFKTGYYAGYDVVPRNNFSIVGGLWDKDFNQIAQDNRPVDPDGNTQFNFSEYLSVLLDNHSQPYFTFPFDLSSPLKRFPDYVLPFYAGFAERYDGVIRKVIYTPMHYAVPGGLNRETILSYNSLGEPFFTVYENQISFLTWAPDPKKTSPNVPEILFFYLGKNPGFAQVRIVTTAYFTDGTNATLYSEALNIVANDVIELSVGCKALKFATEFPTKAISSWSVALQGGGEAGIEEGPPEPFATISETRTFVIDAAIYENERIFIFQNSFGKCFDVVRFTGRGSKSIELDIASSSSETNETATFYNPTNSKYSASELQRHTANSGWITREVKDYLRDLLLSKNVFELKDDLIFPVIITTDKIKEHFVDGLYLFNLDIEYDRAYRDFFFHVTE